MSEAAYEHNGGRVSRERFYAVACDPSRNVAVEACAGAGKTWMLVSRIVRALLGGAQPHEILAITFTKKAAGEMRSRLNEWLAEFAHADDGKLHRELLARGVASPSETDIRALRGLFGRVLEIGRSVQVRTFHSWFAALVRNAPVAVLEELGLPLHYELLEDDKDAVALVWRPFYDALMRDAQARGDYEATVAVHGRSNTLKALTSALSKRVEFTLADAHGVPASSVQPFGLQFPDLAALQHPWEAVRGVARVRELLHAAAGALAAAMAATHRECGQDLQAALRDDDNDKLVASLFTQKGTPRAFSNTVPHLATVQEAQAEVTRLLRACGQHDAWLHQQRMARLTRILVGCFAQVKRERGWVDMSDLEAAALRMLSDPVLSGWVQERLDARTRHLLVDEFQDTNPLQWQALHAWLSSYAGAGADAPSVFIVGDPKQSIYRFRRAEPKVFRAAQAFVREALGGDLLSCEHTRRNTRQVLDVVNSVMGAAQAQGDYDGYREHTTEETAPGVTLHLPQLQRAPREKRDADAPVEWRDSLAEPREEAEEKLLAFECRQAARWVAQRLQQGTPARDVMVMARRRDRLAAMEEELRALHIPAQQPEKADLSEAPEVQDIVALLDVLVSPTHDLSLARALKSPLFGIGDADLVALAREREARKPITWFELVQEQAAGEGPLGQAARHLTQWQKLAQRLPPHDVLETVFAQGDVVARFTAAAPPALRKLVAARLKALLAAALEVEGGRYLTPYAFVRALKAGGIAVPAVPEVDAVQLLTVHGAKGLEAPIVVLVDTDAPPPNPETMTVVVDWPGEESAPKRFIFLSTESRPAPCCEGAVLEEQRARKREELNGLYVAMTRAKRELVLSAVQPHKESGASWWKRVQPLCAATEAPEDIARDVATEARVLLRELPRIVAAAPGHGTVSDKSKGSEQTRFGEALHRLLEQWRHGMQRVGDVQVRRVAREFGLDAAKAQEAARMAQRIVAGQGAWAWEPQRVAWAANEVPLQHGGQFLRIDRLVRRLDTGEWWVLDYKSNFDPSKDGSLVAQMRGYCEAVRAAYPGEPVRGAFLSGNGKLIEVS
jgi:ATP-dependent helicase/nuclease subunit A